MDWSTLNETLSQAAGKAQQDDEVSLRSFVISIGTAAGVLIVAAACFLLLHTRFPQIYYPRFDRTSSRSSSSHAALQWWIEVFARADDTIIIEHGLDAFLLLRFLRTALVLFGPLTMALVPTLIPLNVTATRGLSAIDSRMGLARLSWSNLPTDQWWRYWAHGAACTVVVLYFAWTATTELAFLTQVRRQWLLRNASRSATVLVTDIPPAWLDAQLPSRLEKYYRRFAVNLVGVQVVQDDRAVLSQIYRRDQAVVALETLATRLDHETSPYSSEPLSPAARADLLRQVRVIRQSDHEIQREIQRTSQSPLRARMLPCAFLHFTDPASAHMLCQVRHHGGPPFLHVHRLDHATDDHIVWNCIHLPTARRTSQRLTASVFVLALAVAWVVPISAVSMLSQLGSLQSVVPALSRLPSTMLALLQGVVPAALLMVLMNGFPYLLTWMTRQQAHPTRAAAELSFQWVYFIFLYLQVFFVASVSAALTVVIPRLIRNPTSVPALLAQNLPLASNYFLSYLPLSSSSQGATLLLRVSEWVCHLPRRSWFGEESSPRTQWTRMRARSRVSLSHIFPALTLLMCLGIIFSVMAPLILPGAAPSLGLLGIIYRYLVLSVLDIPVDSGGLLYWQAWQQLWVGTYTLMLCELGLFGLVGARGPLCSMLALLLATGTYHYYLCTRQGLRMEFLPSNGDSEKHVVVGSRTLRHPRLSSPGPVLWLPEGRTTRLLRPYLAVSTAGLVRKSNGAIACDGRPPDEWPQL